MPEEEGHERASLLGSRLKTLVTFVGTEVGNFWVGN